MKIKLLNSLTTALLFLMPGMSFGQAITLGTAAKYVLFTTTGAMTNAGVPHLTHLTGNVGSNLAGSISGFGNVDGQMHAFDVSTGQCVADVNSLYSQLNLATPTAVHPVLLGGGETLVPGVYHILANATLNTTLTLDAGGSPGAVFIFQIDGTFSTTTLSKVKIINGGLACNVFWKVEGLISVASGTTLRGTFVAHNAAINMSALDTVEGRMLSINGAVGVNSLMAYTPLGCGSPVLTGPAAPALVSSAQFGVFSNIGAVTSTPITYVIGDVGSNSTTTTGFNPLNVTGVIHTPPDAATAAAAGSLTNAYNYLVALPVDIELTDPANFGYDLVLTPHTYHLGAVTMLNGNVILNAQGNPDAVFVIQVNGAFNTTSLSKITLANGTQAKNVYWKIDGAVHVFPNSVFNGTIIAAGAITLDVGDTLNGRALTIGGAIAINGSYVTNIPPGCVASPISGTNRVCQGLTTTLSDPDGGGTWSRSNTNITIGAVSGIITGITPGTSVVTYTSSLTCTATYTVTVNSSPAPITGPGSVCVAAAINLSNAATGGTWSSSNTSLATAGGLSGIVSGIASGMPTITYTLPTGCIATKTVTVNPPLSAGAITGPSGVCVSSSIALSDAAPGGVWSSSNTTATVSPGGVVTGANPGTDTIRYTVTSACGTNAAVKIITINTTSNPGTITGPSSVCTGSAITLSETVTGGTWSSSNTTATVSASGVVTGVTAGTSTVSYTVNNGCGLATATKTITVNASPNAGTITGPSSVCTGATIILSDGVPGGTWSSSNTTATVSGNVVTGAATGIDTITYTVTNVSCTATATKIITVNTPANAGSISGPSNVCAGFSITLSDNVTGGTWSSSNTTATVSASGVVTGATAGIDTIRYAVANGCGTAIATKIITVIPLPDAGTITGASVVCVGSAIALSDAVPGGVWSSSNTTATVSASGIVTGVAAGTNVIMYTLTNSCGTIVASKFITISALPDAGNISGPSNVCVGSSITLLNGVAGGTWTSGNTTAAVSGGVVTGNTAGAGIITYTVNNGCGIAFTTKTITVNPLPDAGTITGLSGVCVGSSVTLSNSTIGGIWSSSNTTATISGSVVTGVAAGTTTITYAITNGCGTAIAIKIIAINLLPDAGSITGASSVCVGSVITLSDAVTGGTWSSSNAAATVAGGMVTGVMAGADTIIYSVNNGCGTASTTKIITINPLPVAGSITGPSSVCIGSSITLSESVTGGIWSSSNANATVAGGLVTGVTAGVNTVSYTVSNTCGTAITTKSITVNTLPDAGTITGPSSVCIALSMTLTASGTGGTWSNSNANTTITIITGGILVTGITAGTDMISYTITNTCGTDVAIKSIVVNPIPVVPIITTQPPSTTCTGTMYQNYGTATAPQAGATYNWTATNATVWAQGTGHQYSLVSFTNPGIATVTLQASFGSGCSSKSTVTVNVATTIAETPVVSYFNNHFVCTPNTENAYQWGYDDVHSLDSTLLAGEINQDYINTNPDFGNKYYWVMTSTGSCLQKTYYNIPTALQNVNNTGAEVSISPNPANAMINVTITSVISGNIQVEIVNVMGQKISKVQAKDNKAIINIAALSAGYYLVNCYRDGLKIATSRFIKN